MTGQFSSDSGRESGAAHGSLFRLRRSAFHHVLMINLVLAGAILLAVVATVRHGTAAHRDNDRSPLAWAVEDTYRVAGAELAAWE